MKNKMFVVAGGGVVVEKMTKKLTFFFFQEDEEQVEDGSAPAPVWVPDGDAKYFFFLSFFPSFIFILNSYVYLFLSQNMHVMSLKIHDIQSKGFFFFSPHFPLPTPHPCTHSLSLSLPFPFPFSTAPLSKMWEISMWELLRKKLSS